MNLMDGLSYIMRLLLLPNIAVGLFCMASLVFRAWYNRVR